MPIILHSCDVANGLDAWLVNRPVGEVAKALYNEDT